MLTFLEALPAADLPAIADLAVIDDGSPTTGEVMNLLARRNLLYQPVKAPSARFRLNIVIGQPRVPARRRRRPQRLRAEDPPSAHGRAADLAGLRQRGGDCTADRRCRADRLHLINYGGREIEGLRVRVRGGYGTGDAWVEGTGRVGLVDRVVADGATEFSCRGSAPMPWSISPPPGEFDASSSRASRPAGRRRPRSAAAVQIHPAPVGAHHEQRIVERVARGSAAGEHRDAQHPLDRPAGARVHDVRIRTPSASNNFSELPETDRARSLSVTVSAAFRESTGSWIVTSQPRPGRRAEPVDRAASRADEGRGYLSLLSSPTTRSTA